ncbi:MAG: mechanosensitive ion channel family protein [Bacilli bacterium]|jgi:small conductance mechanosensitive channel
MKVLSAVSDYFANLWEQIKTFFTNNGSEIITRTFFAILAIVVGHYLIKLLIYILRKALKINDKRVDRSARAFLINLLKLVLRILLVLLVLSIIKVDLTGLATIISAAVLAIGLSVQDVISNFASGVIILTTKPFLTGQWVEIDGASGSVESVGMLTTTLVTIDQQLVVIPNKAVVNSKIKNYHMKPTRRANITLDFPFDVDVEQVRSIAMELINAEERILSAPAPMVVVATLTDLGVGISIRFYVPTGDYWNVYFKYNEDLIGALKKANIIALYRTYQLEVTNK